MSAASNVEVSAKNQSLVIAKVKVVESGCWEAISSLNRGGYARIQHIRRSLMLHRFSYESFVGRIPDGLHIDHLCRNRRCANPLHLEPVTLQENILRGIGITSANASKTHCESGHVFSIENTYVRKGGRMCKECARAAEIRYRGRKRKLAKDDGMDRIGKISADAAADEVYAIKLENAQAAGQGSLL